MLISNSAANAQHLPDYYDEKLPQIADK